MVSYLNSNYSEVMAVVGYYAFWGGVVIVPVLLLAGIFYAAEAA